jgi:hypothetical protein
MVLSDSTEIPDPKEAPMAEVTPAQKRQWLKEHGYQVADRGRLSAEHEQAFSEGYNPVVLPDLDRLRPDVPPADPHVA